MNGPEHYREAESEHERADASASQGRDDWQYYMASAQVHATLALAASTAMGLSDMPAADWDQWRDAASAYVRPQAQPVESEGGPE